MQHLQGGCQLGEFSGKASSEALLQGACFKLEAVQAELGQGQAGNGCWHLAPPGAQAQLGQIAADKGIQQQQHAWTCSPALYA